MKCILKNEQICTCICILEYTNTQNTQDLCMYLHIDNFINSIGFNKHICTKQIYKKCLKHICCNYTF